MAKSEKSQAENETPEATELQLKLYLELVEETGYKRAYTPHDFMQLSREEASKAIHFLKEYKLRDQQLRGSGQRVNGFDKISFAMIYKLCWKAMREKYFEENCVDRGFYNAVIHEYEQFREAANRAKQSVQEGGLK